MRPSTSEIYARQPAVQPSGGKPLKPMPRGVVPISFVSRTAVALARIQLPWVTSFGCVDSWELIEATKGTYDWSFIDAEVNRAQVEGKTLVVRLKTNFDGGSTGNPDWLWTDASPPGPCLKRSIADGVNTYDAYEPWLTTWQAPFATFLRAFAERYEGNQTVAVVYVGGYNMKATEITAANGGLTWDSGYDRGAWAARIIETLDLYARLFPTTRIQFAGGHTIIPSGTWYDIFDASLNILRTRRYRNLILGLNNMDDNLHAVHVITHNMVQTSPVPRFFEIDSLTAATEAKALIAANDSIAKGASYILVANEDWTADANWASSGVLDWPRYGYP